VTFNFLAAWTGLPLKVTSPTLGLVILLPVHIWMLLVLAPKSVSGRLNNQIFQIAGWGLNRLLGGEWQKCAMMC
jgi:hypothetical protein